MSSSGSPDLVPGRLRSIDALRGVAALAVLVSHIHFSWSATAARESALEPAAEFTPEAIAILSYGRFGVGLFLLISGFCIHMVWARAAGPPGIDFVRFWRRRLVRLYPPYAATIAATLAGLFVLFGAIGGARGPEAFGYASWDQLAVDVGSTFLLLQNVTDASPRLGNGPLWTLALEEQLYLMYFALLALRWRFGWGATLAVVITSTLLWRTLPFVLTGVPLLWYEFGPARWLDWALGALAVEAYLGRVRLPAWASSWKVALALGAVAVILNAPLRGEVTLPPDRAGDLLYAASLFSGDTVAAIAFFVALNAVLARERPERQAGRPWRWLAAVGLFSYSLYLTHAPVVYAAKMLALRAGLEEGGLAQTALMIVIRLGTALAAAWVFYVLVERPAIRASRRIAVQARDTSGARPAAAMGTSSSSAGRR